MLASARPPRRFRLRLLALMLGASLLPVAILGVIGEAVLERAGALSLGPLEGLLERVDEELGKRPAPAGAEPGLRADLDAARLSLGQAELARRSLARRAPGVLLAILALSAAAAGLAAFLFGRTLARPVERLAEGMLRYARGDLAHRLPGSDRGDELALLVGQFNRMGDELEAERARLQRAEQLAAWQEVARVMAHDLKNPLTAMKLALGRLARDPSATTPRVAESIALFEEEVERLQRMTQSFSEFARLPPLTLADVALGPLCAEVCALYAGQAVRVSFAGGPAITVRADADQLRRALGNLVKNAVEASGDSSAEANSSTSEVRVSMTTEGRRVVVRVKDAGAGLPGPLEGAALARLVAAGGGKSDKPGGSGLGLPIAYKIAHEHGGELRLVPGEPRGAVALLSLPVAPSEAA
jgi:nitrogen fixation/metabolism regulation signal transduction histidine kinase